MSEIKTYKEQLIEIQKAISDILTGAQEAYYNKQRVRKADLAVLYKQESRLMAKVQRQKTGGIRVRGGTPI
ncbi:MAG: hypothetical protein ACTSXQ_06150 [Alphaproteobacteria bacterium]